MLRERPQVRGTHIEAYNCKNTPAVSNCSKSASAYRYTGPRTGTPPTKTPDPSLGLAEKRPKSMAVPVQPSRRTGTQPSEGYPRANQNSDFSGFGARLETSILGTRTTGRNTVYDPPQSVEKLGTQPITRTSQFAKVQCVTAS
uniref:Uncharacterized protein n=1 Tax=Ananas comosus var. bracteatus TaxID=296719 RepID=A0A6V7PL11_ANACO|nr:unnamed protein product [Ananas comosus var. bracteatus]